MRGFKAKPSSSSANRPGPSSRPGGHPAVAGKGVIHGQGGKAQGGKGKGARGIGQTISIHKRHRYAEPESGPAIS